MISPTIQRFEPNTFHLYKRFSKGKPGSPGLGLGVKLSISPHKNVYVEKLLKLETTKMTQEE